jgi:class 3 adenylate cyclase
MNEELTIASEEYRRMLPGSTWIIPIRFDDGPIPDAWDLGAGRTLHDINYVDLFGPEYNAEADALVHTIVRLMKRDTPDIGGVLPSVSVLFARLQGFTSFSESHQPEELTKMLNEYFEVAVPAVKTPYGGEIDRITGDALMVTFNKRGDQPNHAERAAGAGLALQEATLRLGYEHPDWPRFRVGINSGPVLVSLLGTGVRTHTIVGDTVNTAFRIQGVAPAGSVAIGPDTKALLPDAVTTPLGEFLLKGKLNPLQVHVLTSLRRSTANQRTQLSSSRGLPGSRKTLDR